jgi:hypothetical protein
MKQALRALRLGGSPQNEQSRSDSPSAECRPPSGPARTESAGSLEPERGRQESDVQLASSFPEAEL